MSLAMRHAPAKPSFDAWVGRTETLSDTITEAPVAAPVAALAATLDVAEPRDALPPLWHWIFFTPKARASEIGPDGHARRGVSSCRRWRCRAACIRAWSCTGR
jgi:3-methylfumaryl-CoA hydratase